MQGKRVSHFKVLEKLGSGGMGDVYRARDLRLERSVALKFLPSRQPPHKVRRLKLEARAASRLNHPNICTVYELGKHEGQAFIAMELLEGETLSARLRRGPLPLESVLSWAKDLAAGLQAAHDKGLVHRDIKPANIFITQEGLVKILDFGLVKYGPWTPTEDGDEATLDESESTQGMLLGTVHYMSPEQAAGEPVDARSDLFSLGAVLYEMATGQRPFQGSTLGAVLNSIQSDDPPDPRQRNPQIPASLGRVIAKLLEKKPRSRYQTAGELALDLERASRDHSGEDPTRGRSVNERAVSQETSGRVRVARWSLIAVLLIVALLVFVPWDVDLLRSGPDFDRKQRHLALLPLKQMGGHEEDSVMCDGLLETLASQITRMQSRERSLLVVPLTEIIDKEVSSVEEARRLFSVEWVITGSVWFRESDIRLTLNLVDAESLRQVYSAQIVQPVNQLAQIQERLSTSLAEMLKVEGTASPGGVLAAGSTQISDSFNLYLQGRGLLLRRDRAGNVDSAIEKLKQALQASPDFALAHAALSEAYRFQWEDTREAEWLDRAMEESQKALRLNENLPSAHVSQGRLLEERGRYQEARAAFERALKIDPLDIEALIALARSYENQGQPSSAEEVYRRAVELRPDYWLVHQRLGAYYVKQGQPHKALQAFQRVVELTPRNHRALNNVGAVQLWLGNQQEAAQAFQRSMEAEPNYGACSNLATLAFNAGESQRAVQLYEQALEIDDRSHAAWGNLAILYAHVGMEEKARQTFTRAAELARQRLEVNASDAQVLSDLALYLAHLGQDRAARQHLEKALRLATGDAFVSVNAVSTYAEMDKRGEALKWLRRALEAGLSRELVERSPAFAQLRGFPGYEEILQQSQSE